MAPNNKTARSSTAAVALLLSAIVFATAASDDAAAPPRHPGVLRVVVAAHYDDDAGLLDLASRMLRAHKRGWARATAAGLPTTVTVVGNMPEGAVSDRVARLCARHGLNYTRNGDYPLRGYELGAYRWGVGAIAAHHNPSPHDYLLFTQDSFVPEFAERFPAAVAARGYLAKPACMSTFPPGAGTGRWQADFLRRIGGWVHALEGERYRLDGFREQDPGWMGCGSTTFAARWGDVERMRAIGLFEPKEKDHKDCMTGERFVGYVLGHEWYPLDWSKSLCVGEPDCGLRKHLLLRNFPEAHPDMRKRQSKMLPDNPNSALSGGPDGDDDVA